MNAIPLLPLALALPFLTPPAAGGRAPQGERGEQEGPAQEVDEARREVKRLEAWPGVADEDQVELDVERLRKARTEEMGVQAREALLDAGAGVAPYLLPVLGREEDEDTRRRIVAVLDGVTGPAHTRLLAREFGAGAAPLRRWCLLRVARFPDPGVRAAAQEALARATKARKPDPEDVYAASLCALSAGSLAGFDAVAARAEKHWGACAPEVRTALESVRGVEATLRVAPMLAEESRLRRVCGLNLLAGCGERETAVRLVAPFLDDSDNSLRVAAINALRGIVDGDPPIEKLAVFDAIERAAKWKQRL